MNSNYVEYNPDANVDDPAACVTGVEVVYEGPGFGIGMSESGLRIAIPFAGGHSVYVFDIKGNLAAERSGDGAVDYRIAGLTSGIYIVRALTRRGMVERRIIIP